MSHAYDTRTFTVPTEELPSSFSSLEDFKAFEKDAGGRAHNRSDGLHYLWGNTRNGWAIISTQELLRSTPDAPALQFLSESGHTYTFETEYGLTAVSVLSSADVDAAADQLDRLLSSIRANPSLVYDADYGAMFTDGDIERAAARDYTSARPAFDSNVRADEGEGADYLLTYLRSMLALLRVAQAEGLSVVYSMIV